MKLLDIDTPAGSLCAGEEDGRLVRLSFGAAGGRDETPLLLETRRQLQEYFAGSRREFALPLELRGTEFQKRVWRALESIAYGETRAYADIASAVGNPKAVRAVGMANHNNPIVIIIPCHRVVGKNGSLTGYGGGLDIKKLLLELEQNWKERTNK